MKKEMIAYKSSSTSPSVVRVKAKEKDDKSEMIIKPDKEVRQREPSVNFLTSSETDFGRPMIKALNSDFHGGQKEGW